MTKHKKGKIIQGVVSGIESYGIFVKFDEYYSGLIHISEISNDFVKNINDFVNIGDIIYVKVIDIDDEHFQLKLSIKNIDYKKKPRVIKKKIKETNLGFRNLKYHLPHWIEENLKKDEKKIY